MPIEIRLRQGIVADIAVQVERLRIAETGVRYGSGLVRPIGRHKASETGSVVPGPEVVESGFGIAFFAGELVGHKRMMGCAVVHKGQRVVGAGAFSSARSRSSW